MFCFHKWSVPIGNKQICEKCGKASEIPCTHKWSVPIDNRQACEKCGEVRNIPCADHLWEELDTSYFGANRDKDGKIIQFQYRKIRFKCKRCGLQKQDTF